jgi:hypothetical protein
MSGLEGQNDSTITSDSSSHIPSLPHWLLGSHHFKSPEEMEHIVIKKKKSITAKVKAVNSSSAESKKDYNSDPLVW